jgi:hypothetical protein
MANLFENDNKKAYDNVTMLLKGFYWDMIFEGNEILDWRRIEPFFVSLVTDESGKVYRNATQIYANSPRSGQVTFTGNGHLIYGPANPGKLFLFSAMIIESDAEIRRAGQKLTSVLGSREFKDTAKAAGRLLTTILSATGSSGAIASVVTPAINALTDALKLIGANWMGNPDDVLFVAEGAVLRDIPPAYQWGRSTEIRSARMRKNKPRYGFEYEVTFADDNLVKKLDEEAGSFERYKPVEIV